MTRSELVQKIVKENSNLTLSQGEQAVNIFLEQIIKALTQKNRVELRGFGVFETRDRDPRQGRNPRTGEPVKVVKKSVPFFKAGKQLKDRVNKN